MEQRTLGKIQGAKEAFEAFFDNVEIEGYKADSGVGDQPVNLDIYKGARNRVDNSIKYAKENGLEYDYYVAIESGIANTLGKWEIVNIAVIKDKYGYESFASSAGFPVPEKYAKKIIETDLGHVMDEIFNESDLGQGKGGIGMLTKDNINRIELTRDAFVMALTQFVNGDKWKD